MKFSWPAHVFRLFIRSALGWIQGNATQEGVKESIKDKRHYLKCCHSGSGFGQIYQAADQGRENNRRDFSFDEILFQTIDDNTCICIYLNPVILIVFFLTELFAVCYQVSDKRPLIILLITFCSTQNVNKFLQILMHVYV